MKILVLEDDLERIKFFIENLGIYDLKIVDKVDEAIDVINTETFDMILLDDDLGDGGSGADFALYLSENPDNPNVEADIVFYGLDRKMAEAMLYKLAPVCSEVNWIGFSPTFFDYLGLTIKD